VLSFKEILSSTEPVPAWVPTSSPPDVAFSPSGAYGAAVTGAVLGVFNVNGTHLGVVNIGHIAEVL